MAKTELPRLWGVHPRAGWLVALFWCASGFTLAGCGPVRIDWFEPRPAVPESTSDLPDADQIFANAPADAHPANPLPSPHAQIVLTLLNVQVPREQRSSVAPLWQLVREDALPHESARLIRANGIRAAVGKAERWADVRAILDAAPGRRVRPFDSLRLPAGYPLALELDAGPHDQTIFFVQRDGVLTGEAWPASRNVLRVTYLPVQRDANRLRLELVPEVRQRLPGYRWVRAEGGLLQSPEYDGRAYGAAGFSVELSPSEFVVLSPSEQSATPSLIGAALFARQQDDSPMDTYLFLRVDVENDERSQ